MEVLNIAKIKDGLFIGDKVAGTNLNILIQFKISHLINTCGNQITYNYEKNGLKYLIYNWPENPSNNISFIKEEISNKLLNFIDNSLQKGTGLLIFSFKGQNRACVAIIIYLMKKYNWSLKKSRDYLSTKKKDVKITKNFLNQLMNYEERLFKKNILLSNDWFLIGLKNKDELLMNNTYLNEKRMTKKNYLNQNKNKNRNKINENNINTKMKPHIGWADQINSEYPGKNSLIINCPIINDLFFQKKIIPITNHIKMKPVKSCIKYHFFKRESTSKKIYLLDKKTSSKSNNIKENITDLIDEEIRNNKTHILKKSIIQNNENQKRKRKLTYDNSENGKLNLKNNFFEDNPKKIIINSKEIDRENNNGKEIINKNFKNFDENEKNNNIEDSKYIIQKENPSKSHISKSEEKNKLSNLEELLNLNLDANEENISNHIKHKVNNYINNNQNSLYLHNNDRIKENKKRGLSAKKNTNKNNKILIPNKKYYLGQANSKLIKESEKDIIIPKLNPNNGFQSLNYEYNHNFHNNKMLMRALISDKEIKNNINNNPNSISNNNIYNKKSIINSFEENNNNNIIDNIEYNRFNKPKNAYIFNTFNSYNFKPSGPVKINNNMTYRLSHSLDKNNNNFMEMNNKIFNDINVHDKISNSMKTYKYNRPLSAQKDYLKQKKNNKNSNNNRADLFDPHKRLPSPVTSQFSIMKIFNISKSNQNNRYNISTPINNGRIGKRVYKKK